MSSEKRSIRIGIGRREGIHSRLFTALVDSAYDLLVNIFLGSRYTDATLPDQ